MTIPAVAPAESLRLFALLPGFVLLGWAVGETLLLVLLVLRLVELVVDVTLESDDWYTSWRRGALTEKLLYCFELNVPPRVKGV